MNNSSKRVARLTSSKISVLTVEGRGVYNFGAGAITYIKKKLAELDLGRGLDLPLNKNEVYWGKCWEPYVNDNLVGLEYEMIVNKTTVHPDYEFWSGSEDFRLSIKDGGISELKCYYLEKFHAYAKCIQKQDIELLKNNFKEEYWQIVSNSCIQKTKYGEAMAFMPTENQLLEMRELLSETDYIVSKLEDDEYKYRFIHEKPLYDLPFIPNHSDFKGFNKFRFEVPQSDKDYLTERVEKAIEVINNPELLLK